MERCQLGPKMGIVSGSSERGLAYWEIMRKNDRGGRMKRGQLFVKFLKGANGGENGY